MKRQLIITLFLLVCVGKSFSQYTSKEYVFINSLQNSPFYQDFNYYQYGIDPALTWSFSCLSKVPYKREFRETNLTRAMRKNDSIGHTTSGPMIDFLVELKFDLFKNRAVTPFIGLGVRSYWVEHQEGSKNFVEGIARIGIQFSPLTLLVMPFRKKEYRWTPGIVGRSHQRMFTSFLSNEMLKLNFLVNTSIGDRYSGLNQFIWEVEYVPTTIYFIRKQGATIKMSLIMSDIMERGHHHFQFTAKLAYCFTGRVAKLAKNEPGERVLICPKVY